MARPIVENMLTFAVSVVEARADKVVIRTEIAPAGADAHFWTFQDFGQGLVRTSVAEADSTEDENLPRAYPKLARAVVRAAKAAAS